MQPKVVKICFIFSISFTRIFLGCLFSERYTRHSQDSSRYNLARCMWCMCQCDTNGQHPSHTRSHFSLRATTPYSHQCTRTQPSLTRWCDVSHVSPLSSSERATETVTSALSSERATETVRRMSHVCEVTMYSSDFLSFTSHPPLAPACPILSSCRGPRPPKRERPCLRRLRSRRRPNPRRGPPRATEEAWRKA